MFWLLLCFAATAFAYPVLVAHPYLVGYVRIYNPDPDTVWWCWAVTGRGYVEKYLAPGQSTLWRNDIYEWGCEPA